MLDLKLMISQLKKVSDDEIITSLKAYDLGITDSKFQMAFSTYGVTRWLSGLPLECLKFNAPQIPESELDAVRWRSVFVYRAYVVFVYMRSSHLERGLDKLDDNNALTPFKKFFRSGKKKDKSDTVAQHVRNSLSHGTFELSNDLQNVIFIDQDWRCEFSVTDFIDDLCDQVHRLYACAYEAGLQRT